MEQGTVISNNIFQGVVWNESAVEAVTIVAQGLLNLTKVFLSQNVKIDAMLKINQGESVEIAPEVDQDKLAE